MNDSDSSESHPMGALDPLTGCRPAVLGALAALSGSSVEGLTYLFALLRQPSVACVAKHYKHMPRYITTLADSSASQLWGVRDKLINFSWGTVEKGNTPVELCGRQTVGSVDTVPVSVPAGLHMYQPKYEDNVVKFLVSVSHHGFIMSCDGLFTGSSHDGVIADECEFFQRAALHFPEGCILADGIFSNKLPNCLIPPRRKECREDPNAGKIAKEISYYRSRIEHVFGSGAGLLRFKKMTQDRWSRSVSLLQIYFTAMCMHRNAEILMMHGFSGLYKDKAPPNERINLVDEDQGRPSKKARVDHVVALEGFRLVPPENTISVPHLTGEGYGAGTIVLYNWGVTSRFMLIWFLQRFKDSEILAQAEPNRETGVGLRWLLMNARKQWDLPEPKREGKLDQWISGKIQLKE